MSTYVIANRIIIRHFEKKDLETFFSYRSDPSCQKYQCWVPLNYAQASKKIDQFHKTNLYSRIGQFVIALKDSDDNIGDIFYANSLYSITIGITLHPKYQHQGYAYEALSAWINFLKTKFPHSDFCALVHPDNHPSNNLFIKLHFRLDMYDKNLKSNVYVLDN